MVTQIEAGNIIYGSEGVKVQTGSSGIPGLLDVFINPNGIQPSVFALRDAAVGGGLLTENDVFASSANESFTALGNGVLDVTIWGLQIHSLHVDASSANPPWEVVLEGTNRTTNTLFTTLLDIKDTDGVNMKFTTGLLVDRMRTRIVVFSGGTLIVSRRSHS